MKLLIRQGHVTVNGTTIRKHDYHLDEDRDQVAVDEKPVVYKPYIYVMMNKPAGVVSATRDDRDRTVLDLVPDYAYAHLFPVGRLDKDSEGLLLLTNDGRLARALHHPDRQAAKTYFVRLKKPGRPEDVARFAAGLEISDYVTRPAILEYTGSDEALVTITEGKFHQVKKMFQAVGNEVVYLKRIAMKGLRLDESLQPGQYRELTNEEMELLGIYAMHKREPL